MVDKAGNQRSSMSRVCFRIALTPDEAERDASFASSSSSLRRRLWYSLSSRATIRACTGKKLFSSTTASTNSPTDGRWSWSYTIPALLTTSQLGCNRDSETLIWDVGTELADKARNSASVSLRRGCDPAHRCSTQSRTRSPLAARPALHKARQRWRTCRVATWCAQGSQIPSNASTSGRVSEARKQRWDTKLNAARMAIAVSAGGSDSGNWGSSRFRFTKTWDKDH
mmetsp:Transcript_30817/g.73908  ORF Transcript_30817/g.73908 Transcript_30817/m.73908 type:complete len:226 (-) Transcript_30817:320-997(-)